MYNKEDYVEHITNLKERQNHGLLLKKVHKIIKCKREAWIHPYIDLNTELRKNAENNFQK